MATSPLAGKLPPDSLIVDVPALVTAYFMEGPDPDNANQRVSFGTSGHRGSARDGTFNEAHIMAIAQAVHLYRRDQGIDGPLYLGIDTHALSTPARATALEVLAAAGVDVCIAPEGEFTPTPAVSHAIIAYNRNRPDGLADGIVITPSHNPPGDGGIKYNPPSGGPAGLEVTRWIENKANELLEIGVDSIARLPLARALTADTTHRHDFTSAYVDDLGAALDLEAVRAEGLRLGADPLGGAGVHYWARIADRYGLDLKTVSTQVDPTFRFMTVDSDGVIRMDPSSPDAMRSLIDMKDAFDVAFACDTDYDRHGIVTHAGLMPSNDYLAVAVRYLIENRDQWSDAVGVGKTVVTSGMVDRVCRSLGRDVYEVPVGFKWFVDGLSSGELAFVGEESAGATLLRRDGQPWTTDKDGIVMTLLAGEMMARTGQDPAELYQVLTEEFGAPHYRRVTAPASPEQKSTLKSLVADDLELSEVGGQEIERVFTHASGNGAAIGGLKAVTADAWFAVRPSGTEDVYKIYAESFAGEEHTAEIVEEVKEIVRDMLTT